MDLDSLINTTHNQHFISQAEQQLNSCSPEPKSRKAEIYSFEIAKRKPQKVYTGIKKRINKNLSFQDLFTLVRLEKSERLNLEILFRKYEDSYPHAVAELLKWIKEVRNKNEESEEGINLQTVPGYDFQKLLEPIIKIYTYKTMNWLRNPYKIKEILRIFEPFLNHCIFEPNALRLHAALSKKNNAEENYICSTYEVSPKEYKEWIRLLLLFLYTKEDGSSSLEGFLEQFFLAPEFSTLILIHLFDKHCALLPDTGVIKDSFPEGQVTYMNISRECIISIQHTIIDGQQLDKAMEQQGLSKTSREEHKKNLERSISAKLYSNDLPILSGYNRICVQGSASRVFSATSNIYGIEIIKNKNSDES